MVASQDRLNRSLAEQPTSVLLKIAVELDPDVVAEQYEEGWSREDIISVIETHIKNAIGNRYVEDWQLVGNVDIIEAEVE